MKKRVLTLALALFSVFAFAAEEARLLRFPSVGGDHIIFSYAGDLYVTSINGGAASRITSSVGYETFSRISPDGKTVAFTGQYDGNTEVYTMPVEGGEPFRVTYSATLERDNIGDRMGPNNIIMCWTPDGKSLVFRSRWYTFSGLRGLLFKVPATGGMPEQIPATEGSFCSYSPDGKQLAFNRMFREFRTWKYYRGGQADDIWINKVGTNSLEKITDNDAQDVYPMWIGSEIFYLSDRDHTMNLFVYDTKTKKTEKLTEFTEYDCKFPSFSKDYIVFENGGYIYKYDVRQRKCEKHTIYLANDGVYSRSEYKKVSPRSFSVSPDGSRILSEARGDLFTLPAANGPVYNITRTPQAHEKNARWSPDGKTLAWFSDLNGEYQLYTAPADNPSAAQCRTSFKTGYPDRLTWSPDSRTIYFQTEKNDIYSFDVATGKLDRILVSKFNGYRGFVVSPDSKWLAYTTAEENSTSQIFLYEVATGKSTPVTNKWYDSSSPIFSEDGKYLFFSSARNFHSSYSQVEWNAAMGFDNVNFVLPLAKDTPDPTALRSDEYGAAKDAPAPGKDASKDAPKDGQKGAPKEASKSVEVKVDLDGIIFRASPLEEAKGRLVYAGEDKLYY
ncbi:MAG: PD40 domain-containing protein, partial [Bacteroidales bacterium]|nr:PD40 domain-containing protein [Bacteroidales bacterium]